MAVLYENAEDYLDTGMFVILNNYMILSSFLTC